MSSVALATLVVGLQGCGQRGPLYLPTEPEAANRATLPQLIIPGGAPGNADAAKPASAASPSSQSTDSGARKTTEGSK
ncbi:lipoprotein [Variovorax dokdonensis]|uniref:LPS translocon maturation chaperone LptM n=1 Tax=Variovorax dokdonensis TaxID=344883 RepID=UPI0034A16ECD